MKYNISSERTLTDDMGELGATPGSPTWAIAVRRQIQSLLKQNVSNVQHLRTWLEAIEKHAGYSQLTDENGKSFSSYEEFCQAQQPWGLGYSPQEIDLLLKKLQLEQVNFEEQQSRSWGNFHKYLQRFAKIVENSIDNQSIDAKQIAQLLDIHPKNAHKWRNRWLDLGWIEPFPEQRGFYQITDEGRKQVKQWLEQKPSDNSNEPLWLTIPCSNSQKAVEQLINSLEIEQLKEIHKLLGESLDKR